MKWNGKALSVGAALVDLLLKESDTYLAKFAENKGGMTLCEVDQLTQMIAQTTEKIAQASGGSSCNTALGLAQLGVPSAFLGRIGQDEVGAFFKSSIEAQGVEAKLITVTESTGQVLSVITPDAQRSMFTSLGASAGLVPEDLEQLDWSGVGLVHLEGYLAFNPPFFKAVLAKAKALNLQIALDLSSFDVVRFCRPLLEEALSAGITWLIANEDEAKAFAGEIEEEAEQLKFMAKYAKGCILKVGARGAYIQYANESVFVPTTPVNAIDTTGAGDSWAAGFYAGLWHGKDLVTSAQWGHAVAAQVVQVIGASLDPARWTELRTSLGA